MLVAKQLGLTGPFQSMKNVIRDKGYTGYPIVSITDFEKKAGDDMNIPLFEQFETDTVKYNTDTLVDSEQNFTFRNSRGYINLERTGAAWLGKMSEQRSGIDMKSLGTDGLKIWQARRQDDWWRDALYDGYNLSVTSSATGGLAKTKLTHPNMYPAGDAGSIAEIDSGDVLNSAYLENLQVECNTKNIPKCKLKGYPDSWTLLIHSYQWRTLRADRDWKAEVGMGQFRGEDNPLFSNSVGRYAEILVLVMPGTNIIKAATAAEAGQNAANIRKAILLGASAVFLAVKQDSSEVIPRNENDYGNKNGLGIQSIGGAWAAHWDTNTETTGTRTNQSSILCPTWAVNPKTVATT